MNSPIKCVSFDVWNTLVKSNPDFRKQRNNLIHSHFKLSIDMAVFTNLADKLDVYFNRLTEVTGRHLHGSQMTLLILDRAGANMQHVSHIVLHEFNVKLETLFWEHQPVLWFTDMHETFSYLSRKEIKMGLISNTGFINGNVLHAFFKQHKLTQYLSFECYSDEIGYCKPHAAIFSNALKQVNTVKTVPPNQFLHIGDSLAADKEGATDFGLRSYLLNAGENRLMDIISSYV